MRDEDARNGRAADADALAFEEGGQADAAPGGVLQAEGDNLGGNLRGGGLGMGLGDRGQILQALYPLHFKAPFVLVELGAGHLALAAGCADIAERLGEFHHAQAVAREFLGGFHDRLLLPEGLVVVYQLTLLNRK